MMELYVSHMPTTTPTTTPANATGKDKGSDMEEVDYRITNVIIELPEAPALDPAVVEAFQREFDKACFRILCPPAPEPKPKPKTCRRYGFFADPSTMV
jgi:hypothetical protein